MYITTLKKTAYDNLNTDLRKHGRSWCHCLRLRVWLVALMVMAMPLSMQAQAVSDTLNLNVAQDSNSVHIIISGKDKQQIAEIAEALMNGKKHRRTDPQKELRKQQKRERRDSILVEQLRYPAVAAVKTNLLLWGVVAPNLQVELPLLKNNRWSIELEYFTPWFTWSKNAHAHQFQNVGLELRYYLGNRKYHPSLQGFHVGLAAAVGYYDWEWKRSEGYQGEYINGYINFGYQHRWGTRWGLDMGLGIGAMLTKYRHYYGGSVYPDNHLEEWDEHLIWHDNGHFHWIGPCHANVSLVYYFNKKKKKELTPYFATTP